MFWESTFTKKMLFISKINAPNISLDIANPFEPDNTNNQVILILKYYLYICRCLGDKLSVNVK